MHEFPTRQRRTNESRDASAHELSQRHPPRGGLDAEQSAGVELG